MTGEMAWYAFPTTCSKIRIETLINAILHKNTEKHIWKLFTEWLSTESSSRDHLAQALSSKQSQLLWQMAGCSGPCSVIS